MRTPAQIAESWIGTPYRHQMSTKGLGCDCLGLLRGVWLEFYGIENPEPIPPYSPSWNDHRMDDPLVKVAEKYLLPSVTRQSSGVVFFRVRPNVSAKHCAIVSDDGEHMIHSVNRYGVRREFISEHWRKKICRTFVFSENL